MGGPEFPLGPPLLPKEAIAEELVGVVVEDLEEQYLVLALDLTFGRALPLERLQKIVTMRKLLRFVESSASAKCPEKVVERGMRFMCLLGFSGIGFYVLFYHIQPCPCVSPKANIPLKPIAVKSSSSYHAK